jgi:SsrA-binding protein
LNEILKLRLQTAEKGHTIIPLKIYFKGGLIKVEVGVCKGKATHDKREDIKRKTADREAQRAVAQHRSPS